MANLPKHINSFQLVRDVKDVHSIVLPINSITASSPSSFTIAYTSLTADLLPSMSVWKYRTNISASVSSVTYNSVSGINTILLTSALPSEFLVGTKIKFNPLSGSLSGSRLEYMHNWANSTSAGVAIPMSNELKLAKGYNYGYSFNGSSQYVTHNAISFANGEQWSWCGFVNLSITANNDYAVVGLSGSNNNSILINGSTGLIKFNPNGSATSLSLTGTVSKYKNVHICVTGSNTNVKLYVNGIYSYSGVISSNLATFSGLCRGTTYYFYGKHFRDQICNYALPAERVFELWNNGRPDIYDGMVYTPNTNYIVNGALTADSNWTKGTGWTISGSAANATPVDDSTSAYWLSPDATIVPVIGSQYRIDYSVTSYVNGGVSATLGGASTTLRSATGIYSETITASTTGNLYFAGKVNTSIINNLSISSLTANAVSWTQSATSAIANASTSAEYLSIIPSLSSTVLANTKYKTTLSVTGLTGAGSGVYIDIGGVTGNSVTADGTYSAYITTTSGSGTLKIVPLVAGFTGSITAVDIKAIAFEGSITNVKVVLAGCVLDYAPDTITPSLWIDKSGNENHGTLVGSPTIVTENVRNQ